MGEESERVLARVVVPEERAGERVDGWAAEVLDLIPSRSAARKAMKREEILLEGQVVETSRRIRPGQVLTLLESTRSPRVYALDLELAYVDPHMAVVLKPPGIPVTGNAHRTLVHALPHNLRPSELPDALALPRHCHRLDRGTGGLVVIARTASALVAINRAFQERQVRKRYRALVRGRLEGEGSVDESVEGREALTRWRAVEHTPSLHVDWFTTVDAWPHTGRRHQIRRHLASLGHPIIGDALYTEGKLFRNKGMFLWAVELWLPHPATGEELHVSTPEPYKFEAYRARERRRWEAWQGMEQQGRTP